MFSMHLIALKGSNVFGPQKGMAMKERDKISVQTVLKLKLQRFSRSWFLSKRSIQSCLATSILMTFSYHCQLIKLIKCVKQSKSNTAQYEPLGICPSRSNWELAGHSGFPWYSGNLVLSGTIFTAHAYVFMNTTSVCTFLNWKLNQYKIVFWTV